MPWLIFFFHPTLDSLEVKKKATVVNTRSNMPYSLASQSQLLALPRGGRRARSQRAPVQAKASKKDGRRLHQGAKDEVEESPPPSNSFAQRATAGACAVLASLSFSPRHHCSSPHQRSLPSSTSPGKKSQPSNSSSAQRPPSSSSPPSESAGTSSRSTSPRHRRGRGAESSGTPRGTSSRTSTS